MIRIGNLYVYLKNYIMKFTKLTIAFLSVFFCLVVACGSDGINDDPKTPDVTEPVTPNEPDEPDNPSVVKVPTLQKNVQDEWKIDSIDDGFIYYNYERYDDVSKAQQIVNVLEIDLLSNNHKDIYKMEILFQLQHKYVGLLVVLMVGMNRKLFIFVSMELISLK